MMGIAEISGAVTTQLANTNNRPVAQPSDTPVVRDPVKATQANEKTQAKDQKARPEELQSAIEKIKDFVSATTSDINFSVDKETGDTVVKVVDSSTKEVIRQIPSQEFLDMSKALDRLQGLLLKNKA